MSRKYIHTEEIHNLKTPNIIAPLLVELLNPKSILDVGCGLGTWLNAFAQFGIKDILGVDGHWVDEEMLKISPDQFITHDLTSPLDLKRKFDLVISLEVAEHLPFSAAELFVNSLVSHGDVILFSAAIPGQGGQHHINEQWLSFWVNLFKCKRYLAFDFLRPKIWDNPDIEVWYKQNAILFCKEDHPFIVRLQPYSPLYVDVVHPDLFSFDHIQAQRSIQLEEGKLGVQLAMRALIKAVVNKIW